MLNDCIVSHCGQGKARTELQGGESAWETGGGTLSSPPLQGNVGLASLWEDAALPATLGREHPGTHPHMAQNAYGMNIIHYFWNKNARSLRDRELVLLTKLWQSVVLPTAQGLLQR